MDGLLGDLNKLRQKQNNNTQNILRLVDGVLAALEGSDRRAAAAPSQAPVVAASDQLPDAMDEDKPADSCAEAIAALRVLPTLAEQYKTYHAAISKFCKGVDRTFSDTGLGDICRASASFDKRVLDEVVALHVFREGRFQTAAKLAEEAGLHMAIFQPYKALVGLHEVIAAMERRDLAPAQAWAREHQEKLDAIGSALAFQLARLHFLSLLQGDKAAASEPAAGLGSGAVAAALEFAQQHLAQFAAAGNMEQVQALMGCLVYAGRLERSPYRALVTGHDQLWREAMATLYADGCRLLGLPVEGPLGVCYRAALRALGPLQKMRSVVQGTRGDWEAISELPAEIDLGDSLRFHSVFSCPVSREHASKDNPPMMLRCGHVICRHSMVRLLKGGNRLKCPTCPVETEASQALQLHL